MAEMILKSQNETEAGSPRHWMMYVKWEIVTRWKQRVDQEAEQEMVSYKGVLATRERNFPYSYGSKRRKFLELKGDVLWLITLPAYRGYRQAPSLIARFEIQDARKYDYARDFNKIDPEVRGSGNYIAFARRDPKAYFPINNVFHILLGLKFHGNARDLKGAYEKRDRSKEPRRGPYYSIASHFRTLRRLTDESAQDLENFAQAVSAGHRVFLSYKRGDFIATDGAERSEGEPVWPRRLGEILSRRNISCWWDYWHIPQHTEDKWFEQELLANILEDAVRQSAWFVAIMTEGYCKKPEGDEEIWWTRKEWNQAQAERSRVRRKQDMRRIAVFFDDKPIGVDQRLEWLTEPTDVPLWVGPDPDHEDVCREILRVMGVS